MDGYDCVGLPSLLRAKSVNQENPLLKDHIKETLIRLKQFKNFVEANAESIDYEKLKMPEFFEDLAIALFIHDLGKIDFNFQKEVYRGERESVSWRKTEAFFETDVKMKHSSERVRHEILSSIWSFILLNDNERTRRIRTSILLHHYNEYYLDEKSFPDIIHDHYDYVKSYLEFIDIRSQELNQFLLGLKDVLSASGELSEFVKDLNAIPEINAERLDKLIAAVKNKEDDLSSISGDFYDICNEKPDYNFFVFLGILRRCDYSASGGVKIEKDLDLNDVFKDVEENIVSKIEEKLKKKVTLWQKEALDSSKSKNVILVAPTGSGKTEFALMWAGRNNRKLIYTLPLRVALNDLFARFGEADGYFDKENVDILHSTSFIEHLKGSGEGKNLSMDGKMTSSKLMSYPILLTTPDQVFLSSLKYYGFDKLISLYPTASIVIDEIQAYNPEMAAVIINTLKIINDLDGKMLIITATLPPYFKPFLNELGFGEIDLSMWSEAQKAGIKNYKLRRHKVKIVDKTLFDYSSKGGPELGEGFNEIKTKVSDNPDKNILIIVNNVGKAINLYKELKSLGTIPDKDNIYLLHSRLLEKKKGDRIIDIKQKLKENIKGMVLVSTQLVEASVDIDFDVLLTEISPIDSQVQRWGRAYRSRGEDYSSDEPNVFIFSEIDKGTGAIYDKATLNKTLEILRPAELENLDYEKERNLVESTFNESLSDGKPLNDKYIQEIRRNLDYLKYFTAERRSEAQRIFRQIAGVQAIVPEAMKNDKDNLSEDEIKLNKAFAKIIQENNSGKEESWNTILKHLEKEDIIIPINKTEIELFKWKLKALLYKYSMSIPIFYFEKNKWLFSQEFKNFKILSKISSLEDIIEYGDLKNLDTEEINAFE